MTKGAEEHIFSEIPGSTGAKCSCGKSFMTTSEQQQHRDWHLQKQVLRGVGQNAPTHTSGQTKGTLDTEEIAVERKKLYETIKPVVPDRVSWIEVDKVLDNLEALIENSNREAWIDEIGRFPNSIYAKKCGCLSCKQQLKRYAQLRRVPVGDEDGDG